MVAGTSGFLKPHPKTAEVPQLRRCYGVFELRNSPSLVFLKRRNRLEASALTYASRRGLLARRSPLLKLQGDERLIAMARAGNPGAFEAIVDRYQARLLGFCRQMLGSTEDAEDILQEVFVNAYR